MRALNTNVLYSRTAQPNVAQTAPRNLRSLMNAFEVMTPKKGVCIRAVRPLARTRAVFRYTDVYFENARLYSSFLTHTKVSQLTYEVCFYTSNAAICLITPTHEIFKIFTVLGMRGIM